MSVWVYTGSGDTIRFLLLSSCWQSTLLADGEGSVIHSKLDLFWLLNFGAHMVYGSGPNFPVVQFPSATDPQPAT